MKMVIGGEKADSSSNKVIEIYNPSTHKLIDTVPDAAREDIDRAVGIAREGRKIWADTPLFKRSEILLRFAELVDRHRAELIAINSEETGKIVSSSEDEVNNIITLFRGYVEKAKHFYGISLPDIPQAGFENDVIFTMREPLGVVAGITPFNFPLDQFAQKAAPALAAGNAVIMKPSSETPRGAIRMTELLLDAGVPGCVAQVVTGRGSTIGSWISSHPQIDAITLTGSTGVGINIAELAARNLHRVFLELGGNDALIIFGDADLDNAVDEAICGRIFASGQVCCSSKRFIVQDTIKHAFAEKLVDKLKKLSVGDPFAPGTDMGPLVSEKAADEVEEQVKRTISQGARCILGFERYDGTFVRPAVLADVTPDMDIAMDMEVFGPVFPIIGFKTPDEAVDIANASKYGLMGGALSKDMNVLMKVAKKMQCGGVVINGSGLYRPADMPFGGYKMSGIGREGVSCTLEEMTQVKTIVMKGVLK